MPNAAKPANPQAAPDNEPRFRIAHLLRDPVLRTALATAEDDLGLLPVLPDDDARLIFRRAYFDARIEEARRELIDALFAAVLTNISEEELAYFQPLRRAAAVRQQEALVRFAGLPAMTHSQLNLKKHAIGKAWLRTDSVFLDAVARDEAYLKAKARAGKEAAQ